MAAQSANQQGIWLTGQRIDNKIFIRCIVIGTGCAVQTAANTGQNITQEAERLRAIGGDGTERFASLRRIDKLTAVMLADFKFILNCRETVN
jgi:hypothetical protein